ncbi:polysaccharide deacetylase family protein [Tumebacillus flagellatus]|uniref:DUF7033 domain-containing protein n=1 Tax=Tumebacillus flagellatus TaxID=1157490 RepID=A0A074LKA0_9BACL|nr:polysaccharide deacetylase family protein [Tumebacillus flagellatus]KEO81020.1 hypothetical protein EL26_23050 [Tumebacillus flagellatus]
MLLVTVPPGFMPEKFYIIKTMIEEFLGLPCTVTEGEGHEYLLWLDNGSMLAFEDHFFGQCDETAGYLTKEMLPPKVRRVKMPFAPESDLLVLYGTGDIKFTTKRMECGVDLFASAFFMLSRWEEAVVQDRDGHGRFPAESSVAVRHGFLHRPVVCEYAEFLWNLLRQLGLQQERKERKFQYHLTHDVDFLYLWKNKKAMLHNLAGDLIKRRDRKKAWQTLKRIIGVLRGRERDPYDTFAWLMDLSEKQRVPSRFYWMSGGVTQHDRFFEIGEERAVSLLAEMERRGHVVGFHPSYASSTDARQWNEEKAALEQVVGQPVQEGRQHYLRFSVPETWRIWEEAGMVCDSTLGYARYPGFRAGVCWEYPVFDVLARKTLNVRERPLVAMEITFLDAQYLGVSEAEAYREIRKLALVCRKYQGEFVLLWHNSTLVTQAQRDLYAQVVEDLAEMVRGEDSQNSKTLTVQELLP